MAQTKARVDHRLEYLAVLWLRGRKYQLRTFGKLEVDSEVTAAFGPWLDEQGQPHYIPFKIYLYANPDATK